MNEEINRGNTAFLNLILKLCLNINQTNKFSFSYFVFFYQNAIF